MTLAPGLRRRCLQMKLVTLYVMSVGEVSYVGVCIVCVNVGVEEKCEMWWRVAFACTKLRIFLGITALELFFLKKNRKSFGQFAKKFYLCTRKRKTTTVRWMRGLVNGLHNRVLPFDSGTFF